MASDIYNYADKVGGDPDSSYYNALVDQLKILEKPETKRNAELTASTKENIKALCETSAADAKALATASGDAVQKFKDFEKECKTDRQNLEYRENDIKRALEGANGKIKKLNDEIEEKRSEWWKDYREFVIGEYYPPLQSSVVANQRS